MLETCCDVLAESYARGWITSRDGNLSIRHAKDDYFFISPTAVRKQKLQYEMFKKIKVTDTNTASYEVLTDNDLNLGLKPSGELPMHYGLQRCIDTDVRVVLHLHPTYTVAAMYAKISLPELLSEFPELNRYTKVGPTVPLIPPITQQLADACITALGYDHSSGSMRYNIIGMDRHGVVAIDRTPWRAFEHVERLEHIAQIVLASKK